MVRRNLQWVVLVAGSTLAACGKSDADDGTRELGDAAPSPGPARPANGAGPAPAPAALPEPSCESAGGSAEVAEPTLLATLSDRWHEAWLASPAVADLDADGEMEIVVPRDGLVLGWHVDGEIVFRAEATGGRIWASPVVADLAPGVPGLEVAVASRDQIWVWDAEAEVLPGFPVSWRDELRALAAADIDADGDTELVAVTTNKLSVGDRLDILIAFEMNGDVAEGFPPNTTGTSGCDDRCYTQGGFDQTLALGDLDGDGAADLFAPQDNAYVSLHRGDGNAFDSHPMFEHPSKTNGVRFLHALEQAQQGWAEDEESALQAHFTNTAPALADLDDDGQLDLIALGSVQNAAQSDRFRGVALWAFRPDGTRLAGWESPFHVPEYLAGLWDFDGTNVVGATNQVSVAELDPEQPGPELVFAGFDGRIHAVSATAEALWSYRHTTDERVLTGGVAIADLSADGVPEIVFNSYSPDAGKGQLFVLGANGELQHALQLPGRGAMPVPTIADVDGDDDLEIVVSLKDGEDRQRQVLIYSVEDSRANCLPWPTGRANLLRDGAMRLR